MALAVAILAAVAFKLGVGTGYMIGYGDGYDAGREEF